MKNPMIRFRSENKSLKQENERLRKALAEMSLECANWKRRALIHNHRTVRR